MSATQFRARQRLMTGLGIVALLLFSTTGSLLFPFAGAICWVGFAALGRR